MAEIFCNTSPLQYLHQLGIIEILSRLVGTVIVPPAVVDEIDRGREMGVSLPIIRSHAWIEVRSPRSMPAPSLIRDLGPGESSVSALASESNDAICLLDDALARKTAERLGIRIAGTLGILIDAKRAGLTGLIGPLLARLDDLGFRVSATTRQAVLRMAGESG